MNTPIWSMSTLGACNAFKRAVHNLFPVYRYVNTTPEDLGGVQKLLAKWRRELKKDYRKAEDESNRP